MRRVDFSKFVINGAKQDSCGVVFESYGMLTAEINNGRLFGEEMSGDKYIVCDVTNESDCILSVVFKFWEECDHDEYWGECSITMGVLPNIRTRLAFPFSAVEGREVFIRRTPGRLKTLVSGRPLKPEKLTKIAIAAEEAPIPMKLTIHDVFISDREPDYPLAKTMLVDKFGQKLNADWKGKIGSEKELCTYLKVEAAKPDIGVREGFSKYGGLGGEGSVRFEPTGYFTVKEHGGRYLLADPDGYPFFSVGLDCVTSDNMANITGIESLCEELPERENGFGWVRWGDPTMSKFDFSQNNLHRVFGETWYTEWSKITRRRMHEYGFNTVACWSDISFAKKEKFPYVVILGSYPRTEKQIFRDFPDVFSPEFHEAAEKYSEEIANYAFDPYLIGYFMSNEPNWAFVNNLNIAAIMLESSEQLVSKWTLIERLHKKYETVEGLNAAWKSNFESFEALNKPTDVSGFSESAKKDLLEFSAEMIHEYIKVPAEALRKYDPNHLNLGIRYAWLSNKILASGSEYIDVFSFNCYEEDPYNSIENFVGLVGKPVIIGEFHFGALDRGLDATGLRGVRTQEDRGMAFRYYMERAASHPYCLGAHYFVLNDQPYLGRFDGENFQIGLIDVCCRPYEEFTDMVSVTNAGIYDIVLGKRSPTTERPEYIRRVGF